MITPSTHRARRSSRRLRAVILTTVYVLIVMSPLASLAMHSKVVTHAVTGECSGDCDICGCSPEKRANHTCCCAMKKQQTQTYTHEDDDVGTAVCCKKKPADKKGTIIACGCPCGSGKNATMATTGSSEVLPYQFSELFITPHSDTQFPIPNHRLTSRHGDPPDPPPRLSSIS